jgi:hypothetical protein
MVYLYHNAKQQLRLPWYFLHCLYYMGNTIINTGMEAEIVGQLNCKNDKKFPAQLELASN